MVMSEEPVLTSTPYKFPFPRFPCYPWLQRRILPWNIQTKKSYPSSRAISRRKCYRSFQWTRYPSKHLIPLVQLLSDRQLGQAIEIFLSRIRITPAQSWKIAEYHHNFEICWLSGIRTIKGTASCFRAVLWKIWSSHNMRGAGCWPRYILQPYVTQQARQRLVW